MKNNYNKAYKQHNNFKKEAASFEQKVEEKIDEVKEELHREEPTIEKVHVEEETIKPTYIGVVSGAAKVYMRTDADKESEPVYTLDEGDELEIIDDSNEEWYNVCNSAGIEGFIMKKFVTV